MTVTQFIRQAAMNNQKVQTPRKTITYEDIKLKKVEDKYCWLCGGKTKGQGLSTNTAIKKTFMDYDRAKNHSSNNICAGCAFCLKHRSLRNYSILATKDRLHHPGRNEWREILFNPPEPPFVAIITLSGQKHLHFKGQIAESQDFYPVLLEETEVIIDQVELARILNTVEFLYSNGFTKTEIETGNYKQHRILDFGINEWEKLESRIKEYRPSGLLDVALYIAQKQSGPEYRLQKEEEKCITTSKPKKEKKQLRLF